MKHGDNMQLGLGSSYFRFPTLIVSIRACRSYGPVPAVSSGYLILTGKFPPESPVCHAVYAWRPSDKLISL